MRRTFAIFLSALMLLSNLGLAAGTHYCGGHSMATKLVLDNHDLACGMEFVKRECGPSDSAHPAISASKCCSNEIISLQMDDNLHKNAASTDLQIAFIAILLIVLLPSAIRRQNILRINFADPPWKARDIQIAYQQFLI